MTTAALLLNFTNLGRATNAARFSAFNWALSAAEILGMVDLDLGAICLSLPEMLGFDLVDVLLALLGSY